MTMDERFLVSSYVFYPGEPVRDAPRKWALRARLRSDSVNLWTAVRWRFPPPTPVRETRSLPVDF